MVLKGTTAAYDLFVEFPQPTIEGLQAVASGYQAVGMRSVVAAMMSDQSFYQAIPGLMDALPENNVDYARSIRPANYQTSLDTCRRLLNDWPFDRLSSKLALAPTVPLHCSDPFIIGCRDLAEEFDSSIHMHLAESKIQAVSAIERYGKTLTAHIDELGLLSPRFTAAHFVWPDGDDILRMADHGCSVAHNPGSNLRLGSGIAPARAFIENGLTLGIGTDGSSCSDNQNMFEAMRTAAFVSRVASPDYTTWLGASEALDLATRGSAAVLGYDTEMGQLKPGYLADIVFLDLANINFVPLNNAINQLVLCEDSSAVESVMIGGKLVLKNRQFTTFDYDALVEEARIAAQRLSETNADRRALGNELESAVGLFCIGLTQQHYHVQRHLDAKTFL
jgi:cytosine/adenosine deaminase-related metal-dependent hydrolase